MVELTIRVLGELGERFVTGFNGAASRLLGSCSMRAVDR
jgi:hypothetical protein